MLAEKMAYAAGPLDTGLLTTKLQRMHARSGVAQVLTLECFNTHRPQTSKCDHTGLSSGRPERVLAKPQKHTITVVLADTNWQHCSITAMFLAGIHHHQLQRMTLHSKKCSSFILGKYNVCNFFFFFLDAAESKCGGFSSRIYCVKSFICAESAVFFNTIEFSNLHYQYPFSILLTFKLVYKTWM